MVNITGGCHCGAIRYQAEGDVLVHALCHCTDCRRHAGAPMVGWTIRLAFARGDDAARLSAFLKATPVPNGIDSDFMASFRLDRRLYADLLEVRDLREQGRQAA